VNRADTFAEPEAAFAVARRIGESATWLDARLLCWVLMPDHWHGLIELGDRFDLPRVLNRFKASTALEANRSVGRIGAVWSRGFHDHALRAEEDLVSVARYVVLNPVRAGLVRRVWDYPFWDAIWL
jgi:REP element-mobilizing transposase RayT